LLRARHGGSSPVKVSRCRRDIVLPSRRASWIVFAVVLGLVGVALVGRLRRTGPAYIAVRASRQVMGTLASLEAVGRAGQEASLRRALERAFAAVRQVDARMSTYRSESLSH